MFNRWKIAMAVLVFGSLFGGGALLGTAVAQKATTLRPKDNIAIGEAEVVQLLLLMDTDKNGKVSKQEFMKFMEAEFDRLDKDKSGELDPKELLQMQRPLRPAIGK